MSSIERLIFQPGDGDLVGGLVWRAPSALQTRIRTLREAKALMPDASHFAQATCGEQVRYGIYQPRASEEGAALPRGSVAAAACFSEKVGDGSRNAALVLGVPGGGQRREKRLLVVCLEDGVPVVDVLSNETEARNALGVEDRPIWSDNRAAYPNCRAASFEWLTSGTSRACRLTRIPIDPWPTVAAISCAASVLAGWAIAEHVGSTRRARDDAARALAQDPLPRYLSTLRSMQPDMAVDRAAVVRAVQAMFGYPLTVRGWMLGSAECSATHHRCSARWVRRGGTFDDLRRALPDDQLSELSDASTAPLTFDSATTWRRWDLPRHLLGDRLHPLQRFRAAIGSAAPLLQTWRTAGVVLDFKAPTPWPKAAAVPPSLHDPRIVMAGDVSMRDIPGPFVVEALRDAPDSISWEDVQVEIDHGVDVRSVLRFSATGTFYALQ